MSELLELAGLFCLRHQGGVDALHLHVESTDYGLEEFDYLQ